MPENSEEHARGIQREPDGKLKPGGPSLNPGGRPKGRYSVTDALKQQLGEPADPGNPDGPTMADVFAARMISDGLAGEVKAQVAVTEHIDGKPMMQIQIGADGTSPHDFQLPVRTSRRRRSAAGDAQEQAERDEESIEAESRPAPTTTDEDIEEALAWLEELPPEPET